MQGDSFETPFLEDLQEAYQKKIQKYFYFALLPGVLIGVFFFYHSYESIRYLLELNSINQSPDTPACTSLVNWVLNDMGLHVYEVLLYLGAFVGLFIITKWGGVIVIICLVGSVIWRLVIMIHVKSIGKDASKACIGPTKSEMFDYGIFFLQAYIEMAVDLLVIISKVILFKISREATALKKKIVRISNESL